MMSSAPAAGSARKAITARSPSEAESNPPMM